MRNLLRLPGYAPRCPVHTPQALFRVLWCNAHPENGRACTRLTIGGEARPVPRQLTKAA